jgi:REP element-mobilizing transposase RayT
VSRKCEFEEKSGAYFISFATVNWIDVFTRDAYFWCIIESLDFCRKNKGMELYGYCIMPSHIHLIFLSSLNDPSGLIRDFKGFTSKKMLKMIEDNPQDPSLKERTGEAK